jgi:hypothetical protein
MTNIDNDHDEFEPGVVDEGQHGWAPDAPGTGEAKESAMEANRKAFEGHDTQEASRGDGGEDPDFPPEGVGESSGRRGEDIAERSGSEPGERDLGTKGASERPYGTTGAPDSSSVDPGTG